MFQPNMFDIHLYDLLDMGNKPPENEMDLVNDEYENRSGAEIMEVPSGDDQGHKKKQYHRHTQLQIQEMETFFKECPHPDDKQRKELGRRLDLDPLQVKFWFQNKRTQMKSQHERHENTQLRTENEKLRAENIRYKQALSNASCPNCGSPTTVGEVSVEEQQLRIENARLREEIDRISGIAAKYVGKSTLSYPPFTPGASRSLDLGVGNLRPHAMAGETYGAADLLRTVSGNTEGDKPMIIELAVAAMEELIRMAQAGEPLWIPSLGNSAETLNEDEYMRTFPRGIGPKTLGLKSEASRESTVVIMNHSYLVATLMDANQWASLFSNIVSRPMTLEVLSTGVAGNCNGVLQVMTAEFQVPSPLVPTRENYFARFCKQHAEGIWAVVDVSLDILQPNSIPRCRRRPSGCLIQELQNGCSKITWVEHVEVDDRAVHDIYKPLVNSGLAFGARRWVATLERRCERLASVMVNNISTGDVRVISSPEVRKSILKLAERMVMSFCTGVGASTAHSWTTLSGSGADDIRVMTRKIKDDPGMPPGIVLSAATSFWLPVPPKRVFDFVRDKNSRNEWDIISNGGLVQEMVHIANSRHPANSVSLLRINSADSSQCSMFILQESWTDSTGSYVIYAQIDILAMNVILSGGNPDYVALLPSGFAILPDGQNNSTREPPGVVSGGSLLTVAFEILVDSVPTAELSLGSVDTINNLIKCTVERIRSATLCDPT